PRFPDADAPRTFEPGPTIRLTPEMSREQIRDYLESIRPTNPSADLAFYAFRDMARTDWAPFLKAAVERNPASIKGTEGKSVEEIVALLESWPNESIYDGTRLAQPDEVWNFKRGDGLEKAICLANILKAREPGQAVRIEVSEGSARVTMGSTTATWPSAKGLAVARQL
ncbi:MAG TPA: hypothetical protein VIH35_03745, partial [Kiritimatiellia bacterium]